MRLVPVKTCAAWGCAIGLLVLGLRLQVANSQVSWEPYLDQWEAEVGGLLRPLAHHQLSWRDFVAPNNEHRVVITRLLSWATVALNGEWDNRVTVVLGFLFQAAAIGGTSAFALRCLGLWRGAVIALVALWPAFLVCDWENVVSGFQTQFHVLILGSLVAFALVDGVDRPGRRWGAWALAAAMLGSMASGLLTAAALAGGALLRLRLGPRAETPTGSDSRPRPLGFIAGCVVICLVGFLTRPAFNALDFIHAHRPGAWLAAFLAYASWPLMPNLVGWVALWLPWCALTLRGWRRRSAWEDGGGFTLFSWTLGLWVLLQAAALAWSRAGLLPLVSSRYTGLLVWATVANAGALMLLAVPPSPKFRWRGTVLAAAVLWLAAIGGAQLWRSQTIYGPYYRSFAAQTVLQERRVEAFLRTYDARVITGVNFPEIPYLPDRLLPLLRDPATVALLPAPLRRAAAERSRNAASAAEPILPEGPLTRGAAWLLADGKFVAGLGFTALVALAVSATTRSKSFRSPGTPR
jgi:hypothetical protein